jgi:8-amino-7-oxononanoate synthase
VAAAIEVSLAIVTAEPGLRDRLRQLALCLRTRLAAAGIEVPDGSSQIVPVVIGDNRQAISVAERLQAEGFDVRAVRPPAVPAGTARLRIAANVGLDEATIDRFVSALAAAIPEATRCSVVSS